MTDGGWYVLLPGILFHDDRASGMLMLRGSLLSQEGFMSNITAITCTLVLALAILVEMSGQASAQDAHEAWRFSGTTYFDRTGAEDVDEERGSITTLQPRIGVGFDAARTLKLEDGRSIELVLGASHERYPENDRDNRYFLDGGLDYIIPLEIASLRQFRFGLDFRHARDDEDWVFNRIRLESALRFQLAPRNTLQVRSRVGFRDQNDAHTFRGYDQSEFLLDLTQNWRSEDSVWRTTSMFYFEHQQADRDVYTYDR